MNTDYVILILYNIFQILLVFLQRNQKKSISTYLFQNTFCFYMYCVEFSLHSYPCIAAK